MKIIHWIIFLFSVSLVMMVACNETEFKDPTPKGRMENIYFKQDTFIFAERAGKVLVPIVASKYLNYATKIKIALSAEGIADSVLAVEGKNFTIASKELTMLLGESMVGVDLKLIDDTIINSDRMFALDITSIEGGAYPATKSQHCLVILRNDDFIPEASIVFDQKAYRVGEESKKLLIPFRLTKPVATDIKVYFAGKEDLETSAVEGVNFNIQQKEIILKEGVDKGEVEVEIINNDLPNDDCLAKIAIRKVDGAFVGADSVCAISIINDDLDRVVSLGDTEWTVNEDEGTASLAMTLTGGVDATKLVYGSLVIDSLFGCTESDFVIENPAFSSAGNETITFNIKLKDNQAFGQWGVRIAFRGLTNARAANKQLLVKVIDDERKIAFEKNTFTFPEDTTAIQVKVNLLGGAAREDIYFNIVPTNITTVSEQYVVDKILVINQGTNYGTFTFTPKQHSSKENRELELELTTDNSKVLPSDESVCKIVIQNTDQSIGFAQTEAYVYELPLELSEFKTPVSVQFAIDAPAGTDCSLTNSSGIVLPENTLNITPGTKSTSIKVKINSTESTDHLLDLAVRIVQINVAGVDKTDAVLNADRATCTVKLLNPNITGSRVLNGIRRDLTTHEWDSQVTIVEKDGRQRIHMSGMQYSNITQADAFWELYYDLAKQKFYIVLDEVIGKDGANNIVLMAAEESKWGTAPTLTNTPMEVIVNVANGTIELNTEQDAKNKTNKWTLDMAVKNTNGTYTHNAAFRWLRLKK